MRRSRRPPDHHVPTPGPVYWLERAMARESGAVAAACPPVAGTVRADVCVVGGGYTGLWTALELRALAPDARVVVVEAQGCGLGASGRNGGWATSWYDELGRLVAEFGVDQALWLAQESSAAVRRIGELAEQEGFDCHFRQRGSVVASTAPDQDVLIDAVLGTATKRGIGDDLITEISAAQFTARTGSTVARKAVVMGDSAAVQPALLARGLRTAALRRGVEIFEGSPVVRIDRTAPASVSTPAGRVEAAQVVITSGAWAARLRELRRALVVVGSQIVLTEPVGDRLAELPWRDGTLVGDARMLVHYMQVTAEGRIAFGRGGGAIGPLSRVTARHFVDPVSVATVAADFRRWFPQLADVRLTHAWGGPVDRAPGHLPFVGVLGDHDNVHYGVGYSGNGVGPSSLIGRVLARRALSIRDAYSTCALVSGPPSFLPPEPLRFAGGLLVREAVAWSEEHEDLRGEPAGMAGSVAKRLASMSLPR